MKTEAQKKYEKENIKRITLTYRKNDAEAVKKYADDYNTTTSNYIKSCIKYITDNNIDISKYIDR